VQRQVTATAPGPVRRPGTPPPRGARDGRI